MQIFNWAAAPGANTYTTTAATFDALQFINDPNTHLGYTFLTTAAPVTPNVQGMTQRPLRVSQNGGIAVEDADLTRRQPRSFFAAPALVDGWNGDLTRLGSKIQLIPEPNATVTFTPPVGGAPRTLVRVRPANLDSGQAGDQMTITENCNGTIGDVLGANGELDPSYGAPVFLGTTTGMQRLFDWFAAISIAGGHAPGIDLPSDATLGNAQNAVATAYGQALHAIAAGAPNPLVTNQIQALGVNEFARPTQIGHGLATSSLGYVAPNVAQQITDHTNNRVLQDPAAIANVMWNSHWGGVVAIDGSDYITLENYNRLREVSPATINLTNDGAAQVRSQLFYVQMYGANRSWHTQWATPFARGKQFADAITARVVPRNQLPIGYFVPGSKDSWAAVGAATTLSELQRALLNGLNYANVHRYHPTPKLRTADKSRLNTWRTAVATLLNNPPAFAAGPQPTALATHVQQALAAVTPG